MSADLLSQFAARTPCRGRACLITKDVAAFEDPESAILDASDKERSAVYVVSTTSFDRDGDILEATGAVSDNWFKNGASWFLNHRIDDFPVGSSLSPLREFKFRIEPHRVIATEYFDDSDLGRELYRFVAKGWFPGTSVSFTPLELERIRGKVPGSDQAAGYHVKRWAITEISNVGVGANQDALLIELGKSAAHTMIRKSVAWSQGVTLKGNWDESQHPRGQPGNAGEFGPGGSSVPSPEGSATEDVGKDKPGKSPPTDRELRRAYPRIKQGDLVDGREVIWKVNNRDSVDSTLNDYDIMPGLRVVRMEELPGSSPDKLFYDARDRKRSAELADKIKRSGKISPLIIVIDHEGPYVLEGAHRLGALHLLGAKSFPAMVVIDREKILREESDDESSPDHKSLDAVDDIPAPRVMAKASPLDIQAVILPRSGFQAEDDAVKWLTIHEFGASVVEVEGGWQAEQFPASELREGTARTEELTDGVTARCGLRVHEPAAEDVTVKTSKIAGGAKTDATAEHTCTCGHAAQTKGADMADALASHNSSADPVSTGRCKAGHAYIKALKSVMDDHGDVQDNAEMTKMHGGIGKLMYKHASKAYPGEDFGLIKPNDDEDAAGETEGDSGKPKKDPESQADPSDDMEREKSLKAARDKEDDEREEALNNRLKQIGL